METSDQSRDVSGTHMGWRFTLLPPIRVRKGGANIERDDLEQLCVCLRVCMCVCVLKLQRQREETFFVSDPYGLRDLCEGSELDGSTLDLLTIPYWT